MLFFVIIGILFVCFFFCLAYIVVKKRKKFVVSFCRTIWWMALVKLQNMKKLHDATTCVWNDIHRRPKRCMTARHTTLNARTPWASRSHAVLASTRPVSCQLALPLHGSPRLLVFLMRTFTWRSACSSTLRLPTSGRQHSPPRLACPSPSKSPGGSSAPSTCWVPFRALGAPDSVAHPTHLDWQFRIVEDEFLPCWL